MYRFNKKVKGNVDFCGNFFIIYAVVLQEVIQLNLWMIKNTCPKVLFFQRP